MVLSIVLIYSCHSNSLSEKDKELIKLNVALHNSTVGLDMKLRGFNVDTTLVGYNPNGDPDLTMEKLLEYCKKNNINALEFSKNILTTK